MERFELGKYYEKRGLLHTLDPRVKLTYLLFLIASIFYFSSLSTLIFSFSFIFLVVIISSLPISLFIKEFKRIILFFIFFAFLILLTEANGERKAFFMLTRLVLTLTVSSLLTLTTRPKEIAEAIEKTFGRGILTRPIHIFSTIVMIAFRFVPLLMDEANLIIEAQKSRGADFDEKKIIKKAKAIIPILVPLFSSALIRSDELSLSMDARGFSLDRKPTSLYPLKYSKRDYISYIVLVFYLLLSFLMEKYLWL